MHPKHFIEAQQFDVDLLNSIFKTAREMEQVVQHYGSNILGRRVMATLFYEPSTRTRLSFESAMIRLGGSVVTTENAQEFSSASKGETLEDTVRVVAGYSDVIVLRHYESGASQRAADVSEVPIINAGDGAGQHPTQSLLDMYTINREIGRLESISIALVGDLSHGRTVRSLCYLLAKYPNPKIYFVAPESVRMKSDIKEYLTRNEIEFSEVDDLHQIAGEVDVLYQTRIQKERFGEDLEQYEKARGKYIVDESVLKCMRDEAIVMHPLPRVDEIDPLIDSDPRAAYFRQAHNGLYVRMALLKMLLAD
ncbi:MAG: aspartate carbamoyltransferase [Gemmatimonadetes bacterium]|nr:aspartate carbamoyltransferase [Gemmatimonadota bacterium]